MQHVDEQQFTPSGHLHNTRDDTIEHTRQQKERHRQRLERPTKCCIRVAAVVPYQDDGGQTKQIEQMHTDGKARHISYEDEVSVGMWLVGMFLPFQDEPEHNGREERREGIHLTLNRREPKRIRETIDECADKACQQPLRSKLREFRKVANLPEIPEYENLSEEEIAELCKRADKREFEALPPRRKYRKRADDQSNMVKKIGSAMFWEANNIKPFYSFGEYYKGEQRDGVTDFLDICYSDDLDAPHKLDVIRSAIDMMKYKKLEEKHAYLYEMEKNLVEEVKANGLTEIEHATVIPDPYQLRRNYMGVKDAWSLEEERREWEEQWKKDHGIDENTKTVWSSSFFIKNKEDKNKK